jgi:hypothetical protein
MIQAAFEEEATKMDRPWEGEPSSGSGKPVSRQKECRNFKWRRIATEGTGNRGLFVAVGWKSDAGRRLLHARNRAMQEQVPAWNLAAMMAARARFFEHLATLDRLAEEPASYQVWLATADLHSHRLVAEQGQEALLDEVGSIPRLEDIQVLLKAGLGIS